MLSTPNPQKIWKEGEVEKNNMNLVWNDFNLDWKLTQTHTPWTRSESNLMDACVIWNYGGWDMWNILWAFSCFSPSCNSSLSSLPSFHAMSEVWTNIIQAIHSVSLSRYHSDEEMVPEEMLQSVINLLMGFIQKWRHSIKTLLPF